LKVVRASSGNVRFEQATRELQDLTPERAQCSIATLNNLQKHKPYLGSRLPTSAQSQIKSYEVETQEAAPDKLTRRSPFVNKRVK
jgi:hypothetical protein